jgi:hypothetical protein
MLHPWGQGVAWLMDGFDTLTAEEQCDPTPASARHPPPFSY